MFDALVVGGGFNGIYAAWRLARSGATVALVERSANLGGTMWSRHWRGFAVDAGAQVLDLRDSNSEIFYDDVLQNRLRVLDSFVSGSATETTISAGCAFPDFSDDPIFCEVALRDLHGLTGVESAPKAQSYAEHLTSTFGPNLGARLLSIAEKLTGHSGTELVASAASNLPALSRVKLGNDEAMVALKSRDVFFDNCLAVSSFCGAPQFLGKNIKPRFAYTNSGGLQTFCLAAQQRLVGLGVKLIMGVTVDRLTQGTGHVCVELSDGKVIKAASMAWTLPESQLNIACGSASPIVQDLLRIGVDLHLFEVSAADVLGPDYVNNFNVKHRSSRLSSAGIYSNQTRTDGSTFIIVELPVRQPPHYSHPIQEPSPAEIWSEAQQIGFVKAQANYTQHHVMAIPTAYVFGQAKQASTTDSAVGSHIQLCQVQGGRDAFIEKFELSILPRLLEVL